VGAVLDAIGTFFERLADVEFSLLFLAICCHLLKTCCTSMAWRNTIAAAYSDTTVRWRSIWAAYLSGVGVSALVPPRAGDAVKLYLAHRAVPDSTYTALGSTLLVMSFFDMAMAGLIFLYALSLGVLPGFGSLGDLPGFDFRWVARTPEFSLLLALALVILGAVGLAWVRRHLEEFKQRVRQGFAVLADWTVYLRTVALWQAGDWALRFVAIWFFLGAFGIEQSLRNVLLVQVTQSLATLVPVSPGGIGTEQAFIVYVFSGTGVGRATLLAFSVGMKLTLTVVNVIAGFTALFLTLGHTDWRSLVGADKKPAPS
jgi:glycosyltransferase 2 family protein